MLLSLTSGRSRFLALSLLVLFSGAASLGYQVVWFKQFSHAWGNSPAAASTVVAAFLGGLAVGAGLFGRFAERIQSPVRCCGLCELSIGIAGLTIPLLLTTATSLFAAVHGMFPDSPLGIAVVRLALTGFVLAIPCILMGGTLPLLVASRIVPDRNRDGGSGWLYGINTVGGAVGCYVAGFVLLPKLGLAGTTYALVASNLVVDRTILAASQQLIEASRDMRSDLAAHFGTTEARQLLLGGLLLDTADVARLCQGHSGAGPQTDRLLSLEFSAAAGMFAGHRKGENFHTLMDAIDPESVAARFRQSELRPGDLESIRPICSLLARAGLADKRRRLCTLLAALAPDDPVLLQERIAAGLDDESELLEIVQRLLAVSPVDAARAGERARQAGEYASAIAVFETLTGARPESSFLWTELGASYAAAGRTAEAEAAFENATGCDPFARARHELERLRETANTAENTTHVSSLEPH